MHSNQKNTIANEITNPGADASRPRVDAGDIKPGMPVVCSNDGQFAVIDHMEGRETIKLNKDADGVHHYMPLAWVTRVDQKVHVDRPGKQAMREWSTEAPTKPS